MPSEFIRLDLAGRRGVAALAPLAALAMAALAGCGGHELERDRVTGATALAIASTATRVPAGPDGLDLPLRVVYPVKRGHYPLVIFAAGSTPEEDSYPRLGEHWASRGYVVVQLTTPDSAPPTRAAGVADVRRILDTLDDLERRIPALHHSIDRAHVAVAGRQAGARTALALVDPAAGEPRVAALIVLGDPGEARIPSAAGTPGGAATPAVASGSASSSPLASALAASHKPTFLLAATHSRSAPGARPSVAPSRSSRASHYRLEVRDLDACLGNLLCRSERSATSNAPDYAALAALEDASSAFLDGYLRRDPTALAWLASADRPDLVNGRGRLTLQ